MALVFPAKTRQVCGAQPYRAAERSRDAENGEPERLPDVVNRDASPLSHIAMDRRKVSSRVLLEPFFAQHFGRIRNRPQMLPSAGQPMIRSRFFSPPYAFLSLRMVSVIVILMDGQDRPRGVHHRLSHFQRFPERPVVPKNAAHHEGRQVPE